MRVCWIEKKKSNHDEKPSLSLSLTWAELAAQSSRAQASSAAEAAARERAIGVARRGEFEGRGENETAFLSLHLKKEKVAALFFFLDLLLSFFSSSNSSSFSFLFFVMFWSTLQDYIVLLFILSGSDSRPLMCRGIRKEEKELAPPLLLYLLKVKKRKSKRKFVIFAPKSLLFLLLLLLLQRLPTTLSLSPSQLLSGRGQRLGLGSARDAGRAVLTGRSAERRKLEPLGPEPAERRGPRVDRRGPRKRHAAIGRRAARGLGGPEDAPGARQHRPLHGREARAPPGEASRGGARRNEERRPVERRVDELDGRGGVDRDRVGQDAEEAADGEVGVRAACVIFCCC